MQSPLKITVSEPMDTPVQYLAPIEAPRSARPAVAVATRPAAEAETLASLERMIDVPTTAAPAASSGPTVVRNDFAPASQPFRLATRYSLASAEDDPALETKTLSALETMMSIDAPPAVSR